MSKNFAVSTIAGSVAPGVSGTSFTVPTGHGARFTAGQPAVVYPAGTLPSPASAEVVTVSTVVGDVLTVVRAVESSTPRTVVLGDQIVQGITAAMWDALAAAVAGKADASALSAYLTTAAATTTYERRGLGRLGQTITATRLGAVFSQAAQNPAAGATSPTTAGSIYWPWIIDARAMLGVSALDEFYMYYSTDHDGANVGGVWLATAPAEVGPWTGRGRVFLDTTNGVQTETPAVVADPTGAVALIMYYQQSGVSSSVGVQSTQYATSNDGITWTRVGTALDITSTWPSDGHTGYFRPSIVGSACVAHSLAGGGNNPKFAVSRSTDGRTYRIEAQPLGYAMDQCGDGRRVEWNSGDVFDYRGVTWWLGLSSNFVSGDAAKDGRIVIAPISPNLRSLLAPPKVLLYPTSGSETTNYRALKTFIARDGRLLLYYQCDSTFNVAQITIEG